MGIEQLGNRVRFTAGGEGRPGFVNRNDFWMGNGEGPAKHIVNGKWVNPPPQYNYLGFDPEPLELPDDPRYTAHPSDETFLKNLPKKLEGVRESTGVAVIDAGMGRRLIDVKGVGAFGSRTAYGPVFSRLDDAIKVSARSSHTMLRWNWPDKDAYSWRHDSGMGTVIVKTPGASGDEFRLLAVNSALRDGHGPATGFRASKDLRFEIAAVIDGRGERIQELASVGFAKQLTRRNVAIAGALVGATVLAGTATLHARKH